MDIEELKERYKLAPAYVHFCVATVLAVGPALYYYGDKSTLLNQELEVAMGEEAKARSEFDAAKKAKANLPKLEEQRVAIEDQMRQARKVMPDEFLIDEILHTTAATAREVNISIKKFVPQAESIADAQNNVRRKPIALDLEGDFRELATFFDRLVHLDKLVHIEGVSMQVADTARNIPANLNEEGIERLVQRVKIDTKVKMILYAGFK